MVRKQFTSEFKLRAVEAARKGESVREICKRLGVQPPRLYEWIKAKDELEETVDKEMLAKHGDNPQLTLAAARELDDTAPDVEVLKAEHELLQEEYRELRAKYVQLRVRAA